MSRILYWNIQQFGINKMQKEARTSGHKRKRMPDGSYAIDTNAVKRLGVIMSTLGQNTPDILVVVETSTGQGAPGTLISAGGAQGATFLLGELRRTLGATWMLVPPLRLGVGGVQEGISVFYNSANLNFTGPWGWNGDLNPSQAMGGGFVPVNYGAAAWLNCLPAGSTPNVAGVINRNTPYRRLAGQWEFLLPPVGTAAGVPIQFPGPNNRTPFLTTFWDPAANRTIKLVAYHAPPQSGAAANGTNRIADIQEITTDLQANEVAVVVGDFNVNLINPYYSGIAYGRLTAAPLNFQRALNPVANTWPEKGYIGTMLKPRKQGAPANTNGYPGYGYMSNDGNYDSVDNILVKYGTGLAAPANNNFTIVNRVTGAPYNMDIPPGNPQGSLIYQTAMDTIFPPPAPPALPLPIALPLPNAGPPVSHGGTAPGDIGARTRFQGWNNYRKIISTSDHMPLIIDV
jgi:hypothetical protein